MLMSRAFQEEDTIIDVCGVKIGGERPVVIAGPCSVENLDQLSIIGKGVKEVGADMIRGGAYKPRSSPFSFRGLGEEGLKILQQVKEETGLPIVTEAMSTDTLETVYRYADVIQIGSRNMQNFHLLSKVGQMDKPVLLKRGLSATIEEWLMAAEYIMQEGNKDVILCERGIRTFENYTRNTLDISAVIACKKMSHLPIIVDPSHAAGRCDMIEPLTNVAFAAGAHGIMVEVHNEPRKALSDGQQSLDLEQFSSMMNNIDRLMDRRIKC